MNKPQERTEPPPELNDEQQRFLRQYSFSCMVVSVTALTVGAWRLTTVSWLRFVLHFSLSVVVTAVVVSVLFESYAPTARLGHPPPQAIVDYRLHIGMWIIVAVSMILLFILRLQHGRSWRKKAWEEWKWPSFEDFRDDEMRRNSLGLTYLTMMLVVYGLILSRCWHMFYF